MIDINIDIETNIHYGVININSLHEFIDDELDPIYPECEEEEDNDFVEPIGFDLKSDIYVANSAFDNGCLFLVKSPFYTFASYCSPCAPNAGDLDSPNDSGVKTYCFGPDMFETCPYPVYSVETNELIKE